MAKTKWMKNDTGGVTLHRWIAEKTITFRGTNYSRPVPAFWQPAADVFKAKHGNRYVVRVVRPTGGGYDQYSAFSLREGMRLAKFIVGMMYG